jgi:hypothetical protein
VITERLRTNSGELVATKKLTIKAGHTQGVTLSLNPTGTRLVGNAGKLPVTLTISEPQSASPFVILQRRLTLWR